MSERNVIEDELILNISSFLKSIKTAETSVKGFGETFKENVGGDVLSDQLAETERNLERVKQAIQESKENIEVFSERLNEDIGRAQENPTNKKLQEHAGIMGALLDDEIAKKDKLVALEQELVDLKKQLLGEQKAQNKEDNAGGGIGASIKNAVKDAKRFTLAIIGARSAFTGIRRLAQENKTLTETTTAMWKAMGVALEPLFNSIASVIKRLIGYIASFVYYISGVNIIDKALKNGAKSAKSIKQSLAGFDEINNIGSGGGGADTGWMSQLKGIEIDTRWVEFLDKLTGLPSFLKSLIGWIKDPSWEAFSKLLENVGGALTFIGTVLVMINASNPFGWILIGIGLIAKCVQDVGGLGEFVKIVVSGITDWTSKAFNNIGTFFKNILSGIVNWVSNAIDNIGAFFKNIGKKIETFKTSVFNGFKGVANGIIGFFEGVINAGIKALNALIKALNKIQFNIPDWVPLIGGKKFGFNLGTVSTVSLGRLETGTNFVPNDGLAYIHQGEAVIPKKFNDKEYFGGSNDETNQLLTNILNIVSNMDMKPTVAVSDIVKGINKQSRLKGVSVL